MADTSDAENVLRSMVTLYASLSSYTDEGEVNLTTKSGVATRTLFSTRYKLPAFFRFEFWRPHPYPQLAHAVSQYLVGFDGDGAYYLKKEHQSEAQAEPVNRVESAIAAVSGISSGAAHTIGRLLLAELEGLSILDLTNARFNAATDMDGVACYSISARHPRNAGSYELWIEKESLFLRKLIFDTPTSRTEEVRYKIRVGEPLQDQEFAAELASI